MIINLIMGLILMISAFLTGGLGLGIIFIMEYFRKKNKREYRKRKWDVVSYFRFNNLYDISVLVLHNAWIGRNYFFLLVNVR